MIINILEIQLQTVFYPGYSKRNITSVQVTVLGKNNLLSDKCITTAAVWYGFVGMTDGRVTTIV